MDTGRRSLLAGVGTAAAGLAGCTGMLGPGRSSAEGYDIGMSSAEFLPGTYEAAVGTTVVWKNTSSHAHTVTAYDEGLPEEADYFASGGFETQTAAQEGYRNGFGGSIPARGTYEHTFEVPGEYRYFCVPHEAAGMVGTIVVTE